MDDDAADLPLKYTFGYRPRGEGATGGSGQDESLGATSIADSTSWLPLKGNWTLVCRISGRRKM